MKKLVTRNSAEHIQPLYEVLRNAGVPVSVTEEQGRFHLWLIQPAFEAHAKALLAAYEENPQAFAAVQPQSQAVWAPLWRSLAKQAGIFTFLVTLAVLATALWQLLDPQHALSAMIIAHPSMPSLNAAEPWRLVSPAFLHFSATHLIFNLFWWWYLAGRVELFLGRGVLIALFLFTAIASNLAQYLVSGPLFGGLSGVVYGLFGFAMIMSAKRGGPLYLPPALLVFMIGWLVLGYTEVLWVDMANEAHFVGLLSGIVAGAFVRFGLRK
ncbi:rhomboid family intramembrane serine protease [Aliidiomarina celeris]|uniref:rhomboid family intramembrane serine protease n=1 Tax=Aliidiomarina celeris TaxID=2249428 RepID=UPI000DEA5617|nr:rhomboid family intramembrane serine protease [Aliidiomarina celeris]